jgi:hypothetical protein
VSTPKLPANGSLRLILDEMEKVAMGASAQPLRQKAGELFPKDLETAREYMQRIIRLKHAAEAVFQASNEHFSALNY